MWLNIHEKLYTILLKETLIFSLWSIEHLQCLKVIKNMESAIKRKQNIYQVQPYVNLQLYVSSNSCTNQ